MSTERSGDDRYIVPALSRGLQLLQAFGPEHPILTLGQITGAMGLPRSTVYRLAFTLTELGYLVRDDEAKSYRLGPRVLDLGFAYLGSQELVELARPHLEALRDRTNCSAHLAILDGTDIVYLARVPDRKALTSHVRIGTRFPAHATSMGRAILAHLSDGEIRALYDGVQMARFTRETPVTVEALLATLARTRLQGVVVSRSNFEPGIASVAAPLFGADGAVAGAINITTPEQTLTGDELETGIAEAVREAAEAISAWLGHRAERRSA